MMNIPSPATMCVKMFQTFDFVVSFETAALLMRFVIYFCSRTRVIETK